MLRYFVYWSVLAIRCGQIFVMWSLHTWFTHNRRWKQFRWLTFSSGSPDQTFLSGKAEILPLSVLKTCQISPSNKLIHLSDLSHKIKYIIISLTIQIIFCSKIFYFCLSMPNVKNLTIMSVFFFFFFVFFFFLFFFFFF